MAELLIRPAINNDRAFILSSWLRSYRKSPDSNLNDAAFFGAYRPIVEWLINTRRVDVIVPDTDDQLILAYMCHEPGILHWLYVKKDFRRNGLAKMLLATIGEHVSTFSTPAGRKHLRLKYRPKVLCKLLNKELNAGN